MKKILIRIETTDGTVTEKRIACLPMLVKAQLMKIGSELNLDTIKKLEIMFE